MAAPPVISIRDLAFAHDAAEAPLFTAVTAHFAAGFTGVVGANGTGKTTLLRLLVGELAPDRGSVEGVTDAVYCAQRTDEPPDTLQAFLEDWDGAACELRGRLDIQPDYLTRWASLSHGERKRTQIAHALWLSPALLAIDEPTNHIDARARDLLLEALRQYRGTGLVVSHDRELLDALCSQCLWLEPPEARVFAGGISAATEQRSSERASAVRERSKAVRENARLQREIGKRREAAASEHQARSKQKLARGDSDGREKIDRARVSDGSAGSQYRQLRGRLGRAQDRLDAAPVSKQYETSIWVDGARSARDAVLKLDAGMTPLGGGRALRWPRIIIRPDQRIAITGRNGTGKSTWIRHIQSRLNVPSEKTVVLPQEIPAAAARELLDDVRERSGAELGSIMNIVSRLNSRPERLLESRQPSPGEVRKLLLALGLSRSPHLIIMDEPTNHLDLPSIEALEAALADCPCALLLVSHDRRFIDRVGARPWVMDVDSGGDSVLSID